MFIKSKESTIILIVVRTVIKTEIYISETYKKKFRKLVIRKINDVSLQWWNKWFLKNIWILCGFYRKKNYCFTNTKNTTYNKKNTCNKQIKLIKTSRVQQNPSFIYKLFVNQSTIGLINKTFIYNYRFEVARSKLFIIDKKRNHEPYPIVFLNYLMTFKNIICIMK